MAPKRSLSTLYVLSSLLLLISSYTNAVQLSELVGASSNLYLEPLSIKVLKTGTAIVSGYAAKSFRNLQLHPSVNIPTVGLNDSTVIIAHIHPKNETVIWANAVTALSEARSNYGGYNFGVTVDSQSNIYVKGQSPGVGKEPLPKGSISIFKYDISGKLIWEAPYSPPLRNNGELIYDIQDFDDSRDRSGIRVAGSSHIILSAQRKRRFQNTPAFFIFSASSGKFLQTVDVLQAAKINRAFGPSDVVVKRTRNGTLICFAFSGENNSLESSPNLFASCTQLKGSGVVRTKTLDSLKDTDGFYHVKTIDFDRSPRAKTPSLFVASEKVTYPSKRKIVNDLFIRRLNTETFNEVNWATGQNKGSTRPVLISLPDPHPIYANSHTSFQLALKHSPKSRSVALLFWTNINLTKFRQETERTGRIIVSGTPRKSSEPTQYWLFFIDKNRRLFPHLIKRDIGEDGEYGPDAMAFSPDEKFVYILGKIRSRQLVVKSIPNPVLRG